MKILFSPIGGNDPVSSSTKHDGSMLHICRHYLPDRVYFYLSKEMVERQNKDDRFRYCIKKLGEQLHHDFHVECIEKPMESEVQEFDFYYEEFEKILNKLESEMGEDDLLYVNVSSGTPAMKSALLVLSVMYGRFIPVQVSTPEKASNYPDRDYDPEHFWAVNKDNEPDAPYRCTEPEMSNLTYRLKRQTLTKYIESYNYAAAWMLGKEVLKNLPDGVYDLLVYAVARLQFDFKKMAGIRENLSEEDIRILRPVQDEEKEKIFEYALSLDVKIKNKEYGDFVRAISPLLTDLFEALLLNECGLDLKPYTYEKKDVRTWSVKKLENTEKGREILKIFNAQFFGSFRDSAVAASNLEPLLQEYLRDNKLRNKVSFLRKVEEKVRNLAAHEIVSITDLSFSKLLGISVTVTKVYKEIQAVADAALGLNPEVWKAYEDMNALICKKLL